MLIPDLESVSTGAQSIANDVTRAVLAGREFSLDEGAYRAMYRQLHDAYVAVAAQREAIDLAASAILARDVSGEISGVMFGAARARNSVNGQANGSLAGELLDIENRLATDLGAMVEAWNRYRAADLEGMATILKAIGR